MSIGAKDRIDVLLVQKYASMKVDNPVVSPSMINPEEMYKTMNDLAQAHLTMLHMQQSLKDICIKAISGNIQYRRSKNLKKKNPLQGGGNTPQVAAAAT